MKVGQSWHLLPVHVCLQITVSKNIRAHTTTAARVGGDRECPTALTATRQLVSMRSQGYGPARSSLMWL